MTVLYIVLGALLVLAGILAANTARKTAKARPLSGQHPEAAPEQLEKYGAVLSGMLGCKTVSVEGSYDDTEFAKLRQVVKDRFPLLHERAEHRLLSQDCWLYKLPGRDTSRNILLMSHHDVVPVDERWTRNPWAGEIIGGKVYGRGAADTKGSLCAILFAMEELLTEGKELPVNVFILSSHNEELGGDGMTEALKWFREQGITLEVILDEGGAIVEPPLGNMRCEMCAMVAVHEKGRLKLRCTAEAASSHVSLTGYKDNPVERMAAFIQEISGKNIFLRRFSPEASAMFEALAPYCGFPMNVLFCNLWLFQRLILRVLPKLNATAGGMVGTTCNFQKIEGSTTGKTCWCEAMLRNISDEDLETDMAAFEAVAKKYGIRVEVTRREYYAPANRENKAYSYAFDTLAKVFPRYPAAPYILPAGTDAWRLSPICDCVLRFAPTRMSKQQLGSIHAQDENLDVAAIFEAAVFYKEFVLNYT